MTEDQTVETTEKPAESADQADVLKALRDAIAEHNELVKQFQSGQSQQAPTPPQDPQVLERQIQELNQKFLSNPAEFLASAMLNLKNTILEEIDRRANETVDTKTFWNDFFRDYPELQGFNDVLQQVMSEESRVIAGMKRHEIAKHVASKARKILEERLEAVRKANSPKETAPPPLGFGAGALVWPTPARGASAGGSDIGKSLSDALKELRRNQYS